MNVLDVLYLGGSCMLLCILWGVSMIRASSVDTFDVYSETFATVAFGDWGEDKPELGHIQRYLANEILDAVFVLGDNNYENAKEFTGELRDDRYDLFTSKLVPPTRRRLPFYAILGNHDYDGDVGALIDYSKFNRQWIMPDRYYFKRLEIRNGRGVEDSWWFDSTWFGNIMTPNDVEEEENPLLFSVCVWFWDSTKIDSKQVADMEASIQENISTCTWTVFTAHHPMRAAVEREVGCIMFRFKVEPLVEKYRINLVLSGHHHTSQVWKVPELPDTTFFIAAGVLPNSHHRPYPNGAVFFDDRSAPTILRLNFAKYEIEWKFVHLDQYGQVVQVLSNGVIPRRRCMMGAKFLVICALVKCGLSSENMDVDSNVFSATFFGDWGNEDFGDFRFNIRRYIESSWLDAVFLLGDNFYSRGVSSLRDSKFLFFARDLVPSECSIPFYAVLGNHDHLGNIQAQIDYSHPNWIMPSRFYFRRFFDEEICVWFWDSTKIDSDQVHNMRSSLLEYANTCRWRVFVAHHPVYSAGVYRTDFEVEKFRSFILPLINEFQIHVVIGGHDHSSQLLMGGNTAYFVAGSVEYTRHGKYDLELEPRLQWYNDDLNPVVLNLSFTYNEITYAFVHVATSPPRVVKDGTLFTYSQLPQQP